MANLCEINGWFRSYLSRKAHHNLWCANLTWGFQCWSFIESLLPCVCHLLNIYSLTKANCPINCIWDQFSLFKTIIGVKRGSVIPAKSIALTQCVACTLALCMWSTLSTTFFYKCGPCPRTFACTSWIPPQHVTLRRARRQLDFTPREGETDRATVSASVSDCVQSTFCMSTPKAAGWKFSLLAIIPTYVQDLCQIR